MKLRMMLVAGALLLGGMLGNASLGYSALGTQQCYYRPGIDADNACTRCSDACLEDGYRCCTIVADQQT